MNSEVVKIFWQTFLQAHPECESKELPPAYYFCDNKKDAIECLDLVLQNVKQATATSLWWYEKHKEALPKVGDKHIITDWDGNPKAVIEITKVEQVPYNQITPEFAAIEGEGDKSLAYWKRVHQAYYTREMEPYGERFSEDMVIVCEYFKTVYKN